MSQIERNPALVAMEAAYPLGALDMSNPDGRLWRDRMRASEAYFADYSWDWEENLELLSDVRSLAKKYGDYVMLAPAIVENLISDIYYRNPDPLIQDKGGNRDISKMVTDVAKSIHDDAHTERKMQDALHDQAWAGFGLPWVSFRQYADVYDDQIIVRDQKVIVKLISPWDARFDPRGREWDMSDHAYAAFRFYPTLSAVMRWEWLGGDDRRRMMAWNGNGARTPKIFGEASVDYYATQSNNETDPDFIQVPMWSIWDRTKKLVNYQPDGASFVLSPQPWPEEFAYADCFPCVYMAKNRVPRNQRGDRGGFVGDPDIRRIKPHLFTIQRLESLFVSANQHTITKYMTVKGSLEANEKQKLSSDAQFQVIEWDPAALDAFPAQMRDKLKVTDILTMVPQSEWAEARHLVGIKHEMDMIAQIIGQSSGDRGGMPVTETATDSSIINARLQRRTSTLRHEAGRHYKQLTKLMFLVMKQRLDLPLQYQMTTKYNKKVWATFSADKLRELDLHFDYAVGSNESRTRDQEFTLRERMATALLPSMQASGDVRGMKWVARQLVDVLNVYGAEEYFNDGVIELLKELAVIMHGVQNGKLNPADSAVVNRQVELISQVMNEMLGADDLQDAMAQNSGTPSPEKTGGASLPKGKTPGQMSFEAGAAGDAAAGAIGGMQ